MSLRVRCTACQTAFLIAVEPPGGVVECPKCGARHRLPAAVTVPPPSNPVTPPAQPSGAAEAAGSVFVPSSEARGHSSRRRCIAGLASLCVLVLAVVAALVLWPRLRPRTHDPVERVAEDYLESLARSNPEDQRRLSTIEEPPAIRGFDRVRRDRVRDRVTKGSFAALGQLHERIAGQYTYDPAISRFTPKHPLGAAAETLDVVQAARVEAEKSGLYEKMASGDPDDIFGAAESLGKVYARLADGVLAPRKILPTYKGLVEESKPPLDPRDRLLAEHVADNAPAWDRLLKRPFHTLRADGPFVFEQAEVQAEVTDQLASAADPPTILRLGLVRFRLEGIDTGWRVISARRIPPGAPDEPSPPSPGAVPAPGSAASPAPPVSPGSGSNSVP